MNFGLQWNRYTMRGPIHGKYFDFAIGCLWNLCKNVYIWCRLSSNGPFGPNKNGLQRFHRCFTGNSKCLPCAEYLKVYLVQCCQKFTFEIVIYSTFHVENFSDDELNVSPSEKIETWKVERPNQELKIQNDISWTGT